MQVGHRQWWLMGVQTVNSEGLPVTGTSTMNDNEDVFPIGKGEFPASQC